MSDTSLIKFKQLLRQLIKDAEKNKESRDLIRELVQLGTKRSSSKKVINKKNIPEFNPFEYLRENGENQLYEKLNKMDVSNLITIIKNYGLDPSRKSHKWRDKEKISNFILERVKNKSTQGDVFSK